MQFNDSKVKPIGFGCWPSAGAMYAPDGRNLGYSKSNDKETRKAIQAAISNGISIFDTAAAYGAGHSERLLGDVIGNSANSQIVTKIGIGIDESTKTLSFDSYDSNNVISDIEQALKRLKRDRIDLLLLHLNSLSIDEASPIFEQMELARSQGKINAYGWSTDFSNSASAMKSRPGFVAIEHAMNVLLDAPRMQKVVETNSWIALIRSPLAMGLLSGKYDQSTLMNSDDIRSGDEGWLQYFVQSKPNPVLLNRFLAIQECLRANGRSTIQGALAWLWAKSPNNIPIPGARTVEHVEQLAQALDFGPLSESTMEEIESLVSRTHEIDAEEREK